MMMASLARSFGLENLTLIKIRRGDGDGNAYRHV
jgi:hypothetical protein